MTTSVVTGGGASTGIVSAPITAPVLTGVGANANAPANANVLGNQNAGGSGGDVSQTNGNASSATVQPSSAQSAGVISAPVVAPLTTGIGVNGSAPADVNVLGNQNG